MSRILFIITIVLSSQFASANGFMDSNYFEPTVACIAGGGAGLLMSTEGNELMYSAAGCAVGAGTMYLINRYYENKYSRSYKRQLESAKAAIRQFEELLANKAANADEGPYSLRIREVVPPQRLSNGEVTAPTIRERLVVPGANFRVGE